MAERKATIYDYARLKKTLCNKGISCDGCPLGIKKNGENVICAVLLLQYTDKANEIILKWCDENPAKTYKDDFLEKFPNANINNNVCRNDVYGINNYNCRMDKTCKDCWSEEIPE